MRRSTFARLVSALPLLVTIAASSAMTASAADPLTREQTPEPLRPWIDWVLHGHETERCPFFQGDGEKRRGSWPSGLTLSPSDRGGRVAQEWVALYYEWVWWLGAAGGGA